MGDDHVARAILLGESMSIDRTFRDLKNDTPLEQLSTLATMGWSGCFGWPELLKSDRILIVSEAGAGKTYECRTQRDHLWNAGQAAFYIDLAALKENNLRDLLSAEEETRLDEWLSAQSDVATFFLDSIDELELTLGKFELALKRFGKAITGHLGRVRIVITTRPIPVDQQVFRAQLPIPPKAEERSSPQAFADVAMRRTKKEASETTTSPEWRNVALMPLSNAQIIQMAQIQGVLDPEALLTDIRSRNAEEFARRPQDLIELCIDWKDNRRVRNHAEQVAHNIHIKLKPRTDRPEKVPLDDAKALEGASRLALAALLTRNLTIRHSAEADNASASESALEPAAVLPEWTSEERATLLERALFGFATYGRVRFHHRSVVEFLAAERLHDRIRAGMTIKAVKRMLFADTPQGETVVRSSLKPVAAWLARRQTSIFSALCKVEPSLLLDYGDPASLSRAQRRHVLRAYVDRYGRGDWRGLNAPQLQVNRFAAADLSTEVRHLWKGGIENPEVRSLLLNLIEAGKMADCADIAFEHAVDPGVSDNERIDAVDALIAIDDQRLKEIVVSLEKGGKGWSARLVRLLIARLFPTHISPAQLCGMLSDLAPTKSSGDLTEHLPYLIAEGDLDAAAVGSLRERLHDLVMEDVQWSEQLHEPVSARDHLIPALTAACLREWREGAASPDLVVASIHAVRLPKRHYSSDERSHELRMILADASPTEREMAFWAADSLVQPLHPAKDARERIFAAAFQRGLDLSYERDWGWISTALGDASRPLEDREVMLEAAIWVTHGEQWREQLASLRPAVADQAALLDILEKRLEPAKPNPEWERMERERKRRKKQAARREAKDHAGWVRFWSEVAENPDQLFSASKGFNTAWNLWRVMNRSGENSRASGWQRRFIEAHFGKGVADRLRQTLMQAWRNDTPTLRSERISTEKNTFLVRWQLGVAAIAAEAEDVSWAQKLSPEEAQLAVRYAPIELNGFPSWLDSLALVQPAAVESVLGAELSLELSEPAVAQSHSMLLQNISHSTSAVAAVFVPRLREWLETTGGAISGNEDPLVGAERLSRVIEILLKHGGGDPGGRIERTAADHLKKGIHLAYARVWLTTLMRLSPAQGVAHFERILDGLPLEQAGEAVGWFAALFGERHRTMPVSLGDLNFSPPLLLRLVRLAYQYVRYEADVRHEGTYSPDIRDNAQDARNALLGALLARTGPDAWAAKLELAADPLCAHLSDRLFALARERLAEEADDITLDYGQLLALDQQGEAPPNTRDAMFSLMRDRLDDLDDVLLQDTSPREGWADFREERILRRAVAHELRLAANGAYTLDQEATTADEKETDIRLRSTASAEEATIELKVGEKDRSARELRDALREQLVKKYMAAESCRSGCLLISIASDRTWHHPDTARQITFEDLISLLNVEAEKIVLELGGAIRLMAKGLDLRPRLPKEKAPKQRTPSSAT
jgi:hypothetical protein